MKNTALTFGFWGLLGLGIFSATSAFAVTRTIICTNSGNGDQYLTVQLRTGMAQLRVCDYAPCPETTEPAAIAELERESPPDAPVSLVYSVIQSDGTLVNDTVRIDLPENDRPVVTLDGDAGRYTNCY